MKPAVLRAPRWRETFCRRHQVRSSVNAMVTLAKVSRQRRTEDRLCCLDARGHAGSKVSVRSSWSKRVEPVCIAEHRFGSAMEELKEKSFLPDNERRGNHFVAEQSPPHHIVSSHVVATRLSGRDKETDTRGYAKGEQFAGRISVSEPFCGRGRRSVGTLTARWSGYHTQFARQKPTPCHPYGHGV